MRPAPIPAPRPLTFLYSYAYGKPDINAALATRTREGHHVIIDSGAFSAWNVGRAIDLPGYLRFLDGLPFAPDWYFTLDVIGDATATKANTVEMMRVHGVPPAPIFTRGSPLADLDWCAEHRPPLVPVGLGLGTRTKGVTAYLRGIMPIIAGRFPVHWLGICRVDLVAQMRPFSCDSTQYQNGERFANCTVYAGRGVSHRIQWTRGTFVWGGEPHAVRSAVRGYGCDPEALTAREAWEHGGVGHQLHVRSQLRLAWDIADRLGTRVCYPVGNVLNVDRLIDAYRAEVAYHRSIHSTRTPHVHHRQDVSL